MHDPLTQIQSNEANDTNNQLKKQDINPKRKQNFPDKMEYIPPENVEED